MEAWDSRSRWLLHVDQHFGYIHSCRANIDATTTPGASRYIPQPVLLRVKIKLAKEAVAEAIPLFCTWFMPSCHPSVIFPRAGIPAADALELTRAYHFVTHSETSAGWADKCACPAG
jgi:hypothetical protein